MSQVKAWVLPQSSLLVPGRQGVRLSGLLTLELKGVRILLLDAVVLHRTATLSGGQGMVSNHRCRTVTLKIQRDAYRGTLLARICTNNVDLFDQTLTLPTASISISNAVGAHLRRPSLETTVRRLPLYRRFGDHRRARHNDDVGLVGHGCIDGCLGVLATFSLAFLLLLLLLKAL